MGLTVGFFKFCLKFIDFLAWPSFALGYPLYASIRAIETNSKFHMKKLITYWIIFTLIALFEHVFAKLIEWVPLWPYIKLIAIWWLEIPRFSGACYVYQNFIHPCLSMDLQVVIRQLHKPYVQIYFNKGAFVVEAERYVKENGSKSLEKLDEGQSTNAKSNLYGEDFKAIPTTEKKEMVSTTLRKCKDTSVVQSNVKAFEPTQTSEAAAAKKVEHDEGDLAQTEVKIFGPPEDKEPVTPPIGAGSKIPEILTSMKVQKQWTCAVCQVTATSEKTWNDHLQGKKHRAQCEELKASKQTETNMSSSSPAVNKLHQANQGLENGVKHTEGDLAQTDVRTFGPAQVKEPETPPIGAESKLREIPDSMKLQKDWTSAVCQVTTTTEKSLNDHVQGNMHKAECEKLNASKQTAKNMSSSSTLNKSHQANQGSENGVKHAEGDLAQSEVKTFGPTEVKQPATPPIVMERKLPEIPAVMNVQKEWTCAMCQVTTSSEKTLNSHLQGKKHRAKYEMLKASKQTTKKMNNSSSSSTVNNSHQGNKDSENGVLKDGSNRNKTEKHGDKVQVNLSNKHSKEKEVASTVPLQCWTDASASPAFDWSWGPPLHGGPHAVDWSLAPAIHSGPLDQSMAGVHWSSEVVPGMLSPLWCNICGVRCMSEIDMAAHIQGRKHLTYTQQMMFNF